jgi:polyisoprenoid-binding protein YceI
MGVMAESEWQIDAARSRVGFTVRHMVVSKVRGRFTRFSGRVVLDETDVTRSRVEARIAVTSVETGDRERDEYLRTSEFLDPAHFPEITFASTRVERAGRGERLRLVGELTIRGVTRAVTLDVEPRGPRKFAATTAIDRRDFQLKWGALVEAGGFMVGDKLEIALEVEAAPC